MKYATLTKETTQTKTHSASAGSKGIAIAPPAYGIDVVDNQPIQAVSAHSQERQSFDSSTWLAREGLIQRQRENKTGLPDNLKAGLENLSGLSMDEVRVHYNSSKPAQLQALAYTQGTNIYVGPGQERHLPHEGWHVVQQMEGRVRPTMQMKGEQVNDEVGLEREAGVMGGKALRLQSDALRSSAPPTRAGISDQLKTDSEQSSGKVLKRALIMQNSIAQTMKEEETNGEETECRIRIMQYGGGIGSIAGDACFISPQNSRRLHAVDFGTADGDQNKAAYEGRKKEYENNETAASESEWETDNETDNESEETTTSASATTRKRTKSPADKVVAHKKKKTSPREKRSCLITHGHKDHIGKKRDYQNFGRVFVGTFPPPETVCSKTSQETVKQNQTLFVWKEKKAEGLHIRGEVLSPTESARERAKGNEDSLGELITIKKGETQTFTFLTLGDMTPNEGKEAVKEAIKKVGGTKKINLIKVPHHGSKHNIGLIGKEVVGEEGLEDTILLISGYTNTESEKLRDVIKEIKPKKVYMLFENEEKCKEYINTKDFETLRGVVEQETKEKKLEVIKNLEVEITEDGKPKYKSVNLTNCRPNK